MNSANICYLGGVFTFNSTHYRSRKHCSTNTFPHSIQSSKLLLHFISLVNHWYIQSLEYIMYCHPSPWYSTFNKNNILRSLLYKGQDEGRFYRPRQCPCSWSDWSNGQIESQELSQGRSSLATWSYLNRATHDWRRLKSRNEMRIRNISGVIQK